jgi:ABC-2 type transport system ATP-binding protein
MQQRLGIGVALVGDPALVILDEPTSALDPIGRIDVRGILRTARDRGAAIFLNSHLLSEVEQVCDRVAIVDRGRVVAEGPLAEVLGEQETRIRVEGLAPAGLAALAGFGDPRLDGDDLVIRQLSADRVPDVVATLVGMGVRVHGVTSGRESLERRFLELVGRGRETAA